MYCSILSAIIDYIQRNSICCVQIAMCEEMEMLIKNYKTKSTSKKRKELKQQKGKEVIAMFKKKKGNDALKSIKEARKILKEADRDKEKRKVVFYTTPISAPRGTIPNT